MLIHYFKFNLDSVTKEIDLKFFDFPLKDHQKIKSCNERILRVCIFKIIIISHLYINEELGEEDDGKEE